MQKVVRAKVIKLLDAWIIYPISNNKWVSPIHVVPRQAGLDDELVPAPIQSGWRICIDYRKLNAATRKDHFPFPFTDQMVEHLAGHDYYCFLDDYSKYNQVPVTPKIRRRQHLIVLLGHSPTVACPLGCAMHPLLFSDAWSAYSLTW